MTGLSGECLANVGDDGENINRLLKFIGHFQIHLTKNRSLVFEDVSTESLWHPLVCR